MFFKTEKASDSYLKTKSLLEASGQNINKMDKVSDLLS